MRCGPWQTTTVLSPQLNPSLAIATRARLVSPPAFLSVFPVLLVLIISFKGLRDIVPAILSLLCLFGVVRWISHIARGIGDKEEIRLFRSWGGKPTTTTLRYADERTDTESIKGLGSQVVSLLGEAPPADDVRRIISIRKGPRFPRKKQDAKAAEKTDHDGGADKSADRLDSLYEPVVAWMRENSRQNNLVFEEEISYGFQRNFFALRRFAIACALLALIAEVDVAVGVWLLIWSAPFSLSVGGVIFIAIVAYLVGVVWFVTEESVKVQGFIYARQLLDSLYVSDPSGKAAGKTARKKQSKPGAAQS